MSILGSCKSLNLQYSGCCSAPPSQTCSHMNCHCDQFCHSNNDCCSDIADIGCYPVSPPSPIFISTSTDTLGKTKFLIPCHHSYYNYNYKDFFLKVQL